MVLHSELKRLVLDDTEKHDKKKTDNTNVQNEISLIRIGRQLKKWHPTNKTFPRKKQSDYRKDGAEVSTDNSFAVLNEEEDTNNEEIQNK